MRPTRWTRRHRVTKMGRGGWSFHRHGFMYVHPVVGNAASGWNLRRLLAARRDQEDRRETRMEEFRV